MENCARTARKDRLALSLRPRAALDQEQEPGSTSGQARSRGASMDVLARFPRIWCPTCNKTQPMIFDVMKANDMEERDMPR
jgi:thiol-disulfide isomerase/thioredoxin